MLSRSNLIILGLALLAAIAGGWLQHESRLIHVPEGVHVANVGDLRPDLALTDTDGKEHRLSDYHGQRVLLNFWASWCVPCLKEMADLNAAQHKFGDQGAIVLGIAMDDPARVHAFLSAHPVDYPILLGKLAEPSTSLRFGDQDEVLPFSVLLDAKGRILATRRGPLDPKLLADWLSPATAP
ncbi:peroxiredoxin family protein [Dyella psychrodurans]|uniref:TlpA family protein disulfide reductase n=1 Tax=Dyella psychrodurans TaxID=1927960 RepID=A0A370WXF5_9GAMM|nr:TlpA disulfide reductase family protein [Dyella psychrodurans]RDS80665.1 TlpA family protein disulfide reductase [Dyella psychrodurans]